MQVLDGPERRARSPRAGCDVCDAGYPRDRAERRRFANALLDAEHIAVMPGESFGKAAAGHIRVAMTIADDQYVAALNRLIRFASGLAAQ